MHVAWNGNKFDQLFILSRAYCFPFYTPQTSLKISPTKLHRPPSCNKSWRRRQSKCSETWIEDNFFSEPWLHARRMSIRIKTQRQPLKIYSKIISIYSSSNLCIRFEVEANFPCKIDQGTKRVQSNTITVCITKRTLRQYFTIYTEISYHARMYRESGWVWNFFKSRACV